MSSFSRKALLSFQRQLSVRHSSSYFITTPIFYVNASPHLGHLHSAVLADASFRHNLLKTDTTDGVFSVGTDEHGTKIQQAAAARALPPEKYCQEITSQYKELFKKFNIKYSHFVHTTESAHKHTVHEIWNKLSSIGLIVKGSYSGWYCDADEAFLSEDQLTTVEVNGKQEKVSLDSGRPVHWVQEDNYKFNLSPFKSDIENWIKQGAVRPSIFEKRLLTWLDEGVADNFLSVSRPASRVYWGIPVPGDSSQTIYVWVDALVNYLTVSGYPNPKQWPPSNQIIGKDILKFHGIYWPALLLALGLPLPERMSVHSHWMVDGEKMSKSKGNIVCPFNIADLYTVDGLRYFLMREATPQSDSNFSDVKVKRILNAELADTFGNLLNRCCGKTVNKWQLYPELNQETFDEFCRQNYSDLIASLESLADAVDGHFSDMNFYKGIAQIIATLHEANKMFESAKPWELRKSISHEPQLLSLLHLTMETLRIAALMLFPVIPDMSTVLLNKLSVPLDRRKWCDAIPSWKSRTLNKPYDLDSTKVVLYRKIAIN